MMETHPLITTDATPGLPVLQRIGGVGRQHGRVWLAVALAGGLLLTCLSTGAFAQSSNQNASNDWNGNWGFRGAADRTVHLLQSDLIRKGEGDYYDNAGKSTNHITVDNREGNFGNVTVGDGSQVKNIGTSGDEIGQNTNTIGTANTSNITIDGSGNNIDVSNIAENTGCLDGSIITNTIDGGGSTGATSASCN